MLELSSNNSAFPKSNMEGFNREINIKASLNHQTYTKKEIVIPDLKEQTEVLINLANKFGKTLDASTNDEQNIAEDKTASMMPLWKKFTWRQEYVDYLKNMKYIDNYEPPHQKGPDYMVPTHNQYASETDQYVKIPEDGFDDSPPVSIITALETAAKNAGDKNAMAVKRDGHWICWTYRDYLSDVRTIAKAFMKLGLDARRCVCILGFNTPEWFISDIAAIFAGGIATGIYTTNSEEACRYVIEQSQSQIVVVNGDAQLEKILSIRDKLPMVKAIVQFTGTVTEPGVLSWSDLMNIGKTVPDAALDKRIRGCSINECCSIFYTSGTTGEPKGAMIHHDSMTLVCRRGCESLDMVATPQRLVSFLPLSHIAAQTIEFHMPIQSYSCVYFAQPDALKGSLKDTLLEVRPTTFMSVPRVYEKMYTALKEKEENLGFVGKIMFNTARKIGAKRMDMRRKGMTTVPFGYGFAKKIFKKVHKAMGFDKCGSFLLGSAPFSREMLDYFESIGIVVLEGYGLTETGACVDNTFYDRKAGSVGMILRCLQIKIDNPDRKGEGEVCMRGRNRFMGYYRAEAKTKETVDSEGWFHSGDLGRIDEDGFLFITGRIKDLIVTAGGENVPPVYIEDNIKKEIPAISNVMVVGDRRRFLSVLLTLQTNVDLDSGRPLDTLLPIAKEWCSANGVSDAETVQDVLRSETLKKAIQTGIDRANEHAISQAQKVQKFILLPVDFSVAAEELGPTLKLKRNYVLQKYSVQIEKLYEEAKGPRKSAL